MGTTSLPWESTQASASWAGVVPFSRANSLNRCSQLEVFFERFLSETGIRLSESFAGSVYRSLRTFKDFSAAASAICSS